MIINHFNLIDYSRKIIYGTPCTRFKCMIEYTIVILKKNHYAVGRGENGM